MQSWRFVPWSTKDLSEWAELKQKHSPSFDNTRAVDLVYKNTTTYFEDDVVSLRIQGVVERCKLDTYGNWNG